MNIRESIQWYVGIYEGSEKRVISHVIQDYKCKEENVAANIKWLINKKYLGVITQRSDMNEAQKRFYDSDSCRILTVIKKYKEEDYWEEEKKKEEEIEKLSNEKKFIEFFKRMENEFDLDYIYNNKNYTYETTNEYAEIKIIDSSEIIHLDFVNTSNWTYNDAEKNIFYKKEGNYYVVELYYMSGKCNVKQYKSN